MAYSPWRPGLWRFRLNDPYAEAYTARAEQQLTGGLETHTAEPERENATKLGRHSDDVGRYDGEVERISSNPKDQPRNLEGEADDRGSKMAVKLKDQEAAMRDMQERICDLLSQLKYQTAAAKELTQGRTDSMHGALSKAGDWTEAMYHWAKASSDQINTLLGLDSSDEGTSDDDDDDDEEDSGTINDESDKKKHEPDEVMDELTENTDEDVREQPVPHGILPTILLRRALFVNLLPAKAQAYLLDQGVEFEILLHEISDLELKLEGRETETEKMQLKVGSLQAELKDRTAEGEKQMQKVRDQKKMISYLEKMRAWHRSVISDLQTTIIRERAREGEFTPLVEDLKKMTEAVQSAREWRMDELAALEALLEAEEASGREKGQKIIALEAQLESMEAVGEKRTVKITMPEARSEPLQAEAKDDREEMGNGFNC